MPSPLLKGASLEYQGNPLPNTYPRVFGASLEYQGNPLPITNPRAYGVALEFIFDPLTTGILGQFTGAVEHVFSKAVDTNVELISRILTADLLEFPEVSGNPLFDTETEWRYIVVTYRNDITAEIFNLVHRKIGPNWDCRFFFPGSIAVGSLRKRAVIVKAKTGEELILHPAEFNDGERVRINP